MLRNGEWSGAHVVSGVGSRFGEGGACPEVWACPPLIHSTFPLQIRKMSHEKQQ
jgi:hypothetical protein